MQYLFADFAQQINAGQTSIGTLLGNWFDIKTGRRTGYKQNTYSVHVGSTCSICKQLDCLKLKRVKKLLHLNKYIKYSKQIKRKTCYLITVFHLCQLFMITRHTALYLLDLHISNNYPTCIIHNILLWCLQTRSLFIIFNIDIFCSSKK